MTDKPIEVAKRKAGVSAAKQVSDGDVVGLGTGSTAAYAIKHLGRRIDEGLTVSGIPTSPQSKQLAQTVGIPLTTLDESSPDISIDGADQVVGGILVKGGGGAHTREKLVASSAKQFVVVYDQTKVSDTLDHPIPVEILPCAINPVRQSVNDIGGSTTVRRGDPESPMNRTEHGNVILDCDFGVVEDPEGLSATLSAIPGVVEHGLFVNIADDGYIGGQSDVTHLSYE